MMTFTILFNTGPAVEYTPSTMNPSAAYQDALGYAERIAEGREVIAIV